MRRSRHGIPACNGPRLLAWLGQLGVAAMLAGCASTAPTATGERGPMQVAGWLSPSPVSLRPSRTAEEDAIIARAILEHEMRRP